MTGCSDRALLSVLDEHGPVSRTRLATELETHPITVTYYCDDLLTDGHVYRVSADVYEITDDGREYLATRVE